MTQVVLVGRGPKKESARSISLLPAGPVGPRSTNAETSAAAAVAGPVLTARPAPDAGPATGVAAVHRTEPCRGSQGSRGPAVTARDEAESSTLTVRVGRLPRLQLSQ